MPWSRVIFCSFSVAALASWATILVADVAGEGCCEGGGGGGEGGDSSAEVMESYAMASGGG